MDRQKVFTAITTHLLTQMKQAIDPNDAGMTVPRCMYRSPEGLKCGIGGIIKDEAYDPVFEGLSVVAMEIVRSLNLSGWEVDTKTSEGRAPSEVINQDTGFLMELQGLHDNNKPDQWKERLKSFARSKQLEFPEQFA